MECRIGKYKIKSDPNNYIIYEDRVVPKTKTLPERTVEALCGYYSTFESALNAIPSHALRRSDAKDLAEALAVVKGYHDLIQGLAKGV